MKKFLAGGILILLPFFLDAQTTTEKTFGRNKYDAFNSVVKTPDGGMIFIGRIDSDGFGNGSFYLVKTDINTDTLWTKIYDSGNSVDGYSIDITADSGFIFTGNMYDYTGADNDIYVIRADKNGDLLWSRTFGGTGYDYSYSIRYTSDDGFIIAATTDSYGPGDYNMYVIKGDANGDTLWTRVIGTDSLEYCTSALETNDGGFLIGGQSWGLGQGEGDYYLIKLDSLGNHAWSKAYGGKWDEDLFSISKTLDGGYILSGNTESWHGGVITPIGTHPGGSIQDAFIVKVNSNGDTLWTRTFGGTAMAYDNAKSIKQTSDSSYVFIGRSYSFNTSQDIYLVKLRSDGDTVWTRVFDGAWSEAGNDLIEHTDGGFVLACYSNSFTATTDAYLIKTDFSGNSGCYSFPAHTLTGSTNAIITPLSAPQFFYGDNGIVSTPLLRTRTIDFSELCNCEITASVSGPDTICAGDLITLSVQGGKYYLWEDGSQNDTLVVAPASSKTYRVVVSNDTCSFQFSHNVIVNTCAGVNETGNSAVSVFPNPSSGNFIFTINDNYALFNKVLQVYNILGEKTAESVFSGTTFILDEDLKQGIYFYKLFNKENKFVFSEGKLIKAN